MTQLQAPPGRTATAPAVPVDRPVTPADKRRRGRLGPVVVGQLVVVECAALAVWFATASPPTTPSSQGGPAVANQT
ncbi:hypothetical protein DLJ57_27190, partial [Micromonospora chalcea]